MVFKDVAGMHADRGGGGVRAAAPSAIPMSLLVLGRGVVEEEVGFELLGKVIMFFVFIFVSLTNVIFGQYM